MPESGSRELFALVTGNPTAASRSLRQWRHCGAALIGGVWAYRRFEWGQRISPFRYHRNYPFVACWNCNEQVRIVSKFCPNCGEVMGEPKGPLVCGHCGHVNREDAGYCTDCGDRLLR